MRHALAALVLALVGCSSAVVDPLPDAGETVDAGPSDDAGELDAEVPIDAGTNDGGMTADAGPADAGMSYPGECSVVPQAGCEPGEACRLTRLTTGLASECGRAGALVEGEELPGIEGGCLGRDDAGAYDACAPGLVCSSAGRWCARYCVVGGPSDQCPPSRGFATTCEAREPGFPVGHCEPVP